MFIQSFWTNVTCYDSQSSSKEENYSGNVWVLDTSGMFAWNTSGMTPVGIVLYSFCLKLFYCARYLGGVPQMCAELCVGLHVKCSLLPCDLTNTGVCWHIFGIRCGEYSFCASLMLIMDKQTDVTELIDACLNLFILVVPGKKKESAWLYPGVTAWRN